jgi:DNA-binding NarL/FixJ family response regulator
MSQLTTVLLIDNHELVRCGIRYLLESRSDLQVVGDAPYNHEVVSLAAAERPHVIILDPDNAEGVSLEIIGDLCEAANTSRILILSNLRDASVCTRSMMLGAVGMLDKRESPDVLFKAINKVRAGEVWLDRARTAAVLTHAVRRRREQSPFETKVESLTKREREIIAGICEGMRNKELAERLFISEATVRNHVTSILNKLELANRFDLVVFSFRHRLVDRA